ncbi:MAG: GNAT family N-acetyltransferase [Gelidibacter sp.]
MITPVTSQEQISITEKLAHKIWNQHYVPIIGQAQVDYMIEKFQNADAFLKQINEGYCYYLISYDHSYCGYLALVSDTKNKKMMISKIYVDADYRGFGLGEKLMDFALKEAKKKEFKTLWLTVNKNNTNSIEWYKKRGFEIKESIQIDIGNGFIMDDYLMELSFG